MSFDLITFSYAVHSNVLSFLSNIKHKLDTKNCHGSSIWRIIWTQYYDKQLYSKTFVSPIQFDISIFYGHCLQNVPYENENFLENTAISAANATDTVKRNTINLTRLF